MGKIRELVEKAGDTHYVTVAKLHFIWGKNTQKNYTEKTFMTQITMMVRSLT